MFRKNPLGFGHQALPDCDLNPGKGEVARKIRYEMFFAGVFSFFASFGAVKKVGGLSWTSHPI